MILPCGCDSIMTGYFDLCAACRNRVSVAAQDAIKWHQINPKMESDHRRSGGLVYTRTSFGWEPHK